jgi:small ligand-binding sensory domain FIST
LVKVEFGVKWASHLSVPTDEMDSLESVLVECCRVVQDQLGDSKPDLAVFFVSPHFILDYGAVPEIVKRELGATVLIGCSAGGLIGGGIEVEQQPAVALTAAKLPGVEITAFHVADDQLPDGDSAPDKWSELVGVEPSKHPSFVLLPDPFTLRVDVLVQGLDYAFPKSSKVGGLASGASRPGLNVLYLDGLIHRQGAVGVALSGDVIVETVVAQGCRPIGVPMRVSRCSKNFLLELDGQQAVSVLHNLLLSLEPEDRELAKTSLFLGVVMDEFKDDFKPGDFLIRNILGIEPNSGALVVAESLRPERTVQFHLRDAVTSADDLRVMLKHYRDLHPEEAAGALLFSCLGRGQYLYGQPNHDSECFKEYLGEIPLGGFFCNGEIGPVSGTTFLHGYTSSFGIFRARKRAGR